MAEFKMPSLGADMTAGTLIQWLVAPGDTVKRGDIIAEVDTDKGVIEVEVYSDGVISELVIEAGQEVPVGTTLAVIDEEGEPADKKVEEAPVPVPARQRVSPSARKLAGTLGIDLADVKGSGHNGRVQRRDVELAAQAKQSEEVKATASVEVKTDPDRFSRMRNAIAAAMSRSKKEIPHYYLGTTIEMDRALDWLAEENAGRPVKERVLYSVLLIKAVALALRDMPEFNAVWENDRLEIRDSINVGTAISLRQGGLIAPGIRQTDKQDLSSLMKSLRDLVNRTRAGSLRSSELSDSTITVTNLGEQSVETVFGVIYPPQVALVGFGKIYEGVSVFEGRLKGCRKINASLAADHRASDGHRGGMFLSAISKLLQEPEKL